MTIPDRRPREASLSPRPRSHGRRRDTVSPRRGRPATRIKISDFGLARHVVDTESMALTAAGALLGTPHYMAPEQWTGRAIDPRTDVYAMGATLFHLLAGRPPFEGETRDELCARSTATSRPRRCSTLNPAVSEGIVRVVERALAKRPEDRYVDAGAMLRDLEALLHGEPTGIPMHPDPAGLRPAPGPAVRVPLGAGVLAAAALAVGDQYRPARPRDRVPRHDGTRPGTRRAAACGPSPRAARPGWSRSARSIRTNGSSRGGWGSCASTARARSSGWSASSS